MKKILILGCKGFIGSTLLSHLSNEFDLYGADIKSIKNENCFLFEPYNPDFLSLFNDSKLNDLFCCINCTGAASVPLSLKKPSTDFELNTINVFRILDSIRQVNSEIKFINLSSAAVYGNPICNPIYEDTIIKPISPYGYSKMYSEQICREFKDIWGIPTVSLRLFSVYGNGLKKQILWDLYQKTLFDTNIELFGTGNESRDYIHVDDLCRAVECVINNFDFSVDSINIANGVEIYIKDIVKLYYEKLGFVGRYNFQGIIREGDPLNWKAQIDRLSSLGYKQKVTLEEGVKVYANWVKGK